MRNPLGLKWSLAVSFIALAFVLPWLKATTSNDLRSYVVKQREVEKAVAVALIPEPMIKHESEWVQSVSHMFQHDLSNAMALAGRQANHRLHRPAHPCLPVRPDRRPGACRRTRHRTVPGNRDRCGKGDAATYWGIDEALAGRATLVSVREKNGPLIMHIEPIKVGGRVVGAVCTANGSITVSSRSSAGKSALSSLVSRTGEIAASSKPWGSTPDSAAIREAFQHKDQHSAPSKDRALPRPICQY